MKETLTILPLHIAVIIIFVFFTMFLWEKLPKHWYAPKMVQKQFTEEHLQLNARLLSMLQKRIYLNLIYTFESLF